MAKFLKNLFSSSSSLKLKSDDEPTKDKEFSAPYDTKRKLSISRSGRMKQNLKNRGKLNGELFGEEIPKGVVKNLEYRVNKRNFFDDDPTETVNRENKINDKMNSDGDNIKGDADPQRRLGNPEKYNHSSDKSKSIENLHTNEQIHKTYINDECDEESEDLAMFEKNIEQILQYKESDF